MSLLDAWAARSAAVVEGGAESHAGGRATLYAGDCFATLRAMADCSIDSVCCDPPYALVSVGKRFGGDGAAPAISGLTGAYARASAGFMGKKWDTGETAFSALFWAECLRVLKPGGHVAAFGGTRTYHRLACAIEDAGFEIRDQLGFCFGTGFPKSLDISKAIDKAAGHFRASEYEPNFGNDVFGKGMGGGKHGAVSEPAVSDAARQWAGYGTALKPAWEPICLARKPLIGTNVENVLKHGVGGLNIDGCRVVSTESLLRTTTGHADADGWGMGGGVTGSSIGRFPANLILSLDEEEYMLREDITSEERAALFRWMNENP